MANSESSRCRRHYRRTISSKESSILKRANIIGAGPNGLGAAIVLAQAGIPVDVFEAESQPGGAVRTMPLTLPGFLHDFGSAVYPMAAGSPFFRGLPLTALGVEWIHGDAALAHPLDDGTAVMLEHDIRNQQRELGADGHAWSQLVGPIANRWEDFAQDSLRPALHLPQHPLLMARFGFNAIQPAATLAHTFRTNRARALFAGISGHSQLSFDQPLSSAVALVLGAAAHVVGWPIPKGGAQSITDALIERIQQLGGMVHTSHRVNSLAELDLNSAATLCDIAPHQLLSIAGNRLTSHYRRTLERFEYGPGAFKVDYALSEPIPWRAAECRRAITVHLGGTFEEIANSEHEVGQGRHAQRPYIILAQPTLFDPTRAPAEKHVAWAYCHVPNGSTADMLPAIESQIERFAPGFRDCILARQILSPESLESIDANLKGGDVNAGALNLRQLIFRPGIHSYSTGTLGLYLCSASTPPGGGVHGMCGYHAAHKALREMHRSIR